MATSPIGWIILSLILGIIIIGLIITVAFLQLNRASPNGTCSGSYGLQTGVDGDIINKCGENRNSPCLFVLSSINQCVTECNVLQDICTAFSYNPTTQTMKIVNPNRIFSSDQVDLYTRQ